MATGKKRGAPAPRPRSGFVTEEQRKTERLNLRLGPEAMGYIERVANEMGCTQATAVLLALEAFEVMRQEKGLPMSWGTRTRWSMEMMNRAGVTKPKPLPQSGGDG